MSRQTVLVGIALVLAASGCSNLGLGEPSCRPPDRGVSSANILTIQAVPTAKYTPCLDESRVGWDTVEWFAEEGRAGIKISRAISPFLTAIVTPSCDVSGATEVDSGFPDIQRYEDIESQLPEIEITVIPSSERALVWSRLLVEDLGGSELDGRPVVLTVEDNVEHQVGPRVNMAFLRDQYVWIVGELDAEEGRLELRGEDIPTAHGVTPAQALDIIEDTLEDVLYRGNWFFVFEGGCITYDFDARGQLAETIAADAEEVFGFYPASLVVDIARQEGLVIE